MLKLTSVLFLLPLFFMNLNAQQDPEAKKVLDAFSKKTKSFASFSANFEIVSDNRQNGETSSNKGSIVMKGSKYKMIVNETEIYFDGKNIYNYTPKTKEVSISLQNKKSDESILNNPSKLFNLYTKDFKYRLLGETNVKNRNCFEVDLYPIDLKKKYSIIKLIIDSEKMELVSAKLIMKSGLNYVLNITSFNNQANATEKDFIFNLANYKGVEVIDLR